MPPGTGPKPGTPPWAPPFRPAPAASSGASPSAAGAFRPGWYQLPYADDEVVQRCAAIRPPPLARPPPPSPSRARSGPAPGHLSPGPPPLRGRDGLGRRGEGFAWEAGRGGLSRGELELPASVRASCLRQEAARDGNT